MSTSGRNKHWNKIEFGRLIIYFRLFFIYRNLYSLNDFQPIKIIRCMRKESKKQRGIIWIRNVLLIKYPKLHSTLLCLWIITWSLSRIVCSRSWASNWLYCLCLLICSIAYFYLAIASSSIAFCLSRAEIVSFWTRGASFKYNYKFTSLHKLKFTLTNYFRKQLRSFEFSLSLLHSILPFWRGW